MHRIRQFVMRRKTLLIRMLAIVLAVFGSVTMLSQAAFAQNTYRINDGGQVTYHTSYATDPDTVLDEAGFELGKDDTYTTQESNGVSEITVRRIQSVTVNNAGHVLSTDAQSETVAQLLNRLNIPVDAQTMLSVSLDEMIYDGMQINIDRTAYVTETYTQTIPYETVQVNDPQLPLGQTEVLSAGSDGEMLCNAQVTYVNGVETARTVLNSQVTMAPVNQMVAVGTAQQESQAGKLVIGDGIITLESGDVLTYDSTMQVLATGYNKLDAGCGNYTSTGTLARVGAIAVDPRVIPYGTRMFIVSNDGQYVYGLATAEDCGGAIKGDRVDLYFDTQSECFTFGRRYCTIYFLG